MKYNAIGYRWKKKLMVQASAAIFFVFVLLTWTPLLQAQTDTLGKSHAASDSVFSFHYQMDSTFSVDIRGIHHKHITHTFVLGEIEDGRQRRYLEPFSMIDFNRVEGFFLGLGSSDMFDFGTHDEFGINGGGGYGFANKRWQYFGGAEYRLPIGLRSLGVGHNANPIFITPPTFAIGANFHNVTSTEDPWRAGRLENAAYAFFAREDFRDYFKMAGWSGYLAFRPMLHRELRIEWRSDNYESVDQQVFYGRWGGNKVLRPNPPVAEGRLNILVLSAQSETAHTKRRWVENVFGDSVEIEQLLGRSDLIQGEYGHMPGTDHGFNRYILDDRHFWSPATGLNIDHHLRYEAGTGKDLPIQKAQFLGGPGSLPGDYIKEISGNRLLLLSTEIRLNLVMLSRTFSAPDAQLVIYNDFAAIGYGGDGTSFLRGLQLNSLRDIYYNVGLGLGWARGIQLGVIWRTDRNEIPRFLFRLNRAF